MRLDKYLLEMPEESKRRWYKRALKLEWFALAFLASWVAVVAGKILML